jgi:hypothetical protein
MYEEGSQSNKSIWRRWHLGALLAHLGLSVLFTWPLLLNLWPGAPSQTPGIIVEDRDQNLWNLWWVREAVFSGQNPFYTYHLYFPEGASLYFHTLNLFNGLLAIPLLPFLSLTTVYNLIVLFSFALTGWGAYLLVSYLCRDRWGALIGSTLFAYSAYHIATMRGLLQLISLEWVPFFVLALLLAGASPRLLSRENVPAWLLKRCLPAACALLLVTLVDWYYTLHVLMLAGLLVLYFLLRWALGKARNTAAPTVQSSLQGAARIGACILLWAVLASPLLAPTLLEQRARAYTLPSREEQIANSADLLAFFQPTRDNKLWGRQFDRRDWPFGNNRYEVYLTFTGLALVLTGLLPFARRRPSEALHSNAEGEREEEPALPGRSFWAGAGLVFFVLALGPVLQVGGAQVRNPLSGDQPLAMPYSWLEDLPVINVSRSPDRFTMPLTLCLGVLAGYGAAGLARTLAGRARGGALRSDAPGAPSLNRSDRRTDRMGAVVAIAAIGLVTIELFPFPYPQIAAERPDWYSQLAQEEGEFTVFELPPQDEYWHGAFRMYNATAHGRPIFGGYLSRDYPHPFVRRTPGYRDLAYGDEGGDLFADSRAEWLSALQLYRTRYVVLQKVRLPGIANENETQDLDPWRLTIQRVLGITDPEHEDEQLVAYRVPAPVNIVPYLSLGDGWYPREEGPNGPFRWTGASAVLRIDAPEAGAYELMFRATTIGDARPMRITYRGASIFEEQVGALTDYVVPLNVQAGASFLTIESPVGTVSPQGLGQGDDPRQLGFALLEVRLESRTGRYPNDIDGAK